MSFFGTTDDEQIEFLASDLSKSLAENVALRRALSHAMTCVYPEEIDFRCPGCVEAKSLLNVKKSVDKEKPR